MLDNNGDDCPYATGDNNRPRTPRVTTWGERRLCDEINLEVDLMARYAASLAGTLCQKQGGGSPGDQD